MISARRLAAQVGAADLDGLRWRERCYVARSPVARGVGLLGTRPLDPDEALLIPRCRSVHTLGMRYRLVCAFLDRAGEVIAVRTLDPWRVASVPGAWGVIETAAGVGRAPSVGQAVGWRAASRGGRPARPPWPGSPAADAGARRA
jgi:uncharacterized membrane protein (UPF0127 family)